MYQSLARYYVIWKRHVVFSLSYTIWNRASDQMYKNRDRLFSMYRFIPVHTVAGTYRYVLIHTKYKSTYQSVPVCTISKSCILDTYRGTVTDLVFCQCSIIVSMINASYSAFSTTVVLLWVCGATVPLFGKWPLPSRFLLQRDCKWWFRSQFSVKAGR